MSEMKRLDCDSHWELILKLRANPTDKENKVALWSTAQFVGEKKYNFDFYIRKDIGDKPIPLICIETEIQNVGDRDIPIVEIDTTTQTEKEPRHLEHGLTTISTSGWILGEDELPSVIRDMIVERAPDWKTRREQLEANAA